MKGGRRKDEAIRHRFRRKETSERVSCFSFLFVPFYVLLPPMSSSSSSSSFLFVHFFIIYIYLFFFTFAHSDRLRNQRNMKPKESHAPKRSAPEIVVIFFSSPVLLFYFFFFFCCFFIFVVISSSSSTCLPAALRLRLSNKVEDERVRDEYYGAATKKKEKKKGKKKNKNFVVGRNIFF